MWSAMMKLKEGMAKSASVMAMMNSLMNVPELRNVMNDMAKEMERVSFILK